MLKATHEEDSSQKPLFTFQLLQPSFSHNLPVQAQSAFANIKCFFQGHFLVLEGKGPVIVDVPCPDFTGTTPRGSSPLWGRGCHRPLLFTMASVAHFVLVFWANESCMQRIFWSVTVHIYRRPRSRLLIVYGRLFLCHRWLISLWHLIINWIKRGISGARYVLGPVTENYLWGALKFTASDGNRAHHCPWEHRRTQSAALGLPV